MKLFVWKDVLCDYSCGMIICVADDLASAQQAYVREWEKEWKMEIFGVYKKEICQKQPLVYDLSIPCEPICHFVTGGE